MHCQRRRVPYCNIGITIAIFLLRKEIDSSSQNSWLKVGLELLCRSFDKMNSAQIRLINIIDPASRQYIPLKSINLNYLFTDKKCALTLLDNQRARRTQPLAENKGV